MTQAYRDSGAEGPGPTGYLALVLAWAVPGLGHFIIGQRARGVLFASVIYGLFALGLLLGGIRSINPPDQAIWTYTQFLTGWPMLVANRIEKNAEDRLTDAAADYNNGRPGLDESGARIAYARSKFQQFPLLTYHPKVQDVGAVYCGIAGMLNLLVIFDVLLRITGSEREVAGDEAPPPVPAPAHATTTAPSTSLAPPNGAGVPASVPAPTPPAAPQPPAPISAAWLPGGGGS